MMGEVEEAIMNLEEAYDILKLYPDFHDVADDIMILKRKADKINNNA